MEPKVSIIIPVYNVEAFLPRCLDSITGQTLREIEIICVDDESPDRSIDILRRYAAADARIRIISQKNKRQGGARNTGFEVARGKWVAFIDSDDWLDADYFERLVATAERHNAEIACTSVEKERGSIRKWNVHYTKEECFDDLQAKFDACFCPPNFNTTNKIYLREALAASKVRFKEHALYEDVEYLMLVLTALGPLVTVPGPLYHYVVHGGSTTKGRQTPQKQRDKYLAHKAFIRHMDTHGLRIGSRYRNLTRRTYDFAGITWLKIKERDGRETLRLLDLLPVWSRRARE